jgi:NADH-quinone oxidoreductase subunit G
VREGDELVGARWSTALERAAAPLRDALDGRGTVAVLGGARLTNESAYAWAKLAKGIIGTDHVDCQMGDGLPAALVAGLPRATIARACTAGGTVIALGPDVKEELPVLYLRLRHAVLEDEVRLFEVGHGRTGLSHLAAACYHGLPGALPELASALLAEQELTAPVTVVLGRTSITEDPATIAAVAKVLAEGLPEARFLLALPRGNVVGALDAGLAPGLLPGRTTLVASRAEFAAAWPTLPEAGGLDAAGILEEAAAGRVDVLVLLGADPVADFPDRALVEAAFDRVPTIVALDRFLTASSSRAHVVLPAAGATEVNGTTTNLEGRVLPLNQKVTPPGTARADWLIAAELARRIGADLGFADLDELWREAEALGPAYAGLRGRLAEDVEREGVVLEGGHNGLDGLPAPRPTALGAAELRLVATAKLYDAAVETQRSPHLAGLAPRPVARLHPADFDKLGVEPGAVVRIVDDQGSLALAVEPDAGVVEGTVAVPFNLPGADLARLLRADRPHTDVRIDTRTSDG